MDPSEIVHNVQSFIKSGQVDRAVAIATENLEFCTASYGSDNEYVAEAHRILSIALRHRREFDNALAHAESSVGIFSRSGAPVESVVKALNALGLVHLEIGEADQCIDAFQRALKKASDRNQKLQLSNNLVSIYRYFGDEAKAQEVYAYQEDLKSF